MVSMKTWIQLFFFFIRLLIRMSLPGGAKRVASENIVLRQLIERLIGTARRELLDQTLFWNERDLQNKLNTFMKYYNEHRCHMGIERQIPLEHSDVKRKEIISMSDYRWENYCRGLIQLPIAA